MKKAKERDLREGISLVKNGEFQARAARGLGIVPSTLSRRLRGSKPHSFAYEVSQTLLNLQKEKLKS
jgi:hypothetical protein